MVPPFAVTELVIVFNQPWAEFSSRPPLRMTISS
jgi:hypothetical protein